MPPGSLISVLTILCVLVCLCDTQVPPFTEKCVSGTYPPKEKTKVPTYIINLDLPAEDRWTEIGKAKGKQIADLVNTLKDVVRIFGNSTEQTFLHFVDKYVGFLTYTLPQPFADELRGLAKASNIPLGEVVLYNLFYEIFTVCTSIISQNAQGELFHARNLDFGLFMGWDVKNHTWLMTEKLRPMVVNLDFRKSNKTVFKSVHFAGYIGVLTGIKPHLFTLSMNERFDLLNGGYIGILEWILGRRSGHWMGFLTRNVMEHANSYAEAKTMLANTTLLAPAYFILGGNKPAEGSIITRSRSKSLQILDLDPRNGVWYLLETNYDQWKKPFFVDDRRTPGRKCMDNVTQKRIGFSTLFDVLSSKPVLNKLTTYTALMQVTAGKLETYLQYCSEPCWLF